MDPTMRPATGSRSAFVSAVAWAFIVPSAIALVAGCVQNALFFLLVSPAAWRAEMGAGAGMFPALASLLLEHAHSVLAALAAFAAAVLVASVGLLQRRDWARRAFIGLMSLGLVWNLLFLLLHTTLTADPRPVEGRRAVETVELAPMSGDVVVLALWLTLTLAFAWVLRRLLAPEIKAEFR